LALLVAAGLANPAGVFRLYTEESFSTEGGQTTSCVLQTETCRLLFTPPAQWSVSCSPTNSMLSFLAPDLSAGAYLRMRPDAAPKPPRGTNELRQELQTRYPSARMMREFMFPGQGQEAPSFLLAMRTPAGSEVMLLFVFFASPGGEIEIEMRTSVDRWGSVKSSFGRLLKSLRIEPPVTAGATPPNGGAPPSEPRAPTQPAPASARAP
jgi:hypothetical protein